MTLTLLSAAHCGGSAPTWIGLNPLRSAQTGTSTQAPVRQVGDQARVGHVAVELERLAAHEGVDDVGRVLVAARQSRCGVSVVEPVLRLPPSSVLRGF